MSHNNRKIRVACIGSAGRKDDQVRMTAEIYQKMKQVLMIVLSDVLGLDTKNVILVSGCAAWSDHVAVDLYLEKKVHGLQLYPPCFFDDDGFYDSGHREWYRNPGRISNYYHNMFSSKVFNDKSKSLHDLHNVKSMEYVTIDMPSKDSFPGFHQRNKKVAESVDYMIAFTFTDHETAIEQNSENIQKQHNVLSRKELCRLLIHEWSKIPLKDGGTQHTWSQCTLLDEKKIHIPLQFLERFTISEENTSTATK